MIVRRLASRLNSRWHSVAARALIVDVAVTWKQLAASGAISAMAFDLFLASIPLLGLLGWALARVAADHPEEVVDLTLLLDLAPEQVQQIVGSHTHSFGAGVAPLVLAGAVWMASNALHTPMVVLEGTLGIVSRRWWHRRAIALISVVAALTSVVLGASLSLSLMGGATGLLQAGLLALRFPEIQLPSFQYFGIWVASALLCLLLAGFFRVVVPRPAPRRILPGCAITLIVGSAASASLGQYVQHLSSLAAYYGSLTVVAVFLLWLWVCSAALLLGAVLNACLEAHADCDSKTQV